MYTVESTTHTQYIENPNGYGKRIPSDYDIFAVKSPDGVTIQKFSALEMGLEDAEYMALEMRDRLNAELRAKTLAQPVDILAEKNQRIAELEGAIERAMEALDPYLNANSPYTPDVLAAAAYLREVVDGEKA